jgi:uncharacterized membrane protein
MPVFRVLMIALAIATMATAALWLLTGNRKWMTWSLRCLRTGVIAGLVFFAVLVFEQLSAR